jgi:hypothetical protein
MLLLRCYASALVQQCPYELLDAVTVVDHRSIAKHCCRGPVSRPLAPIAATAGVLLVARVA